MTTEKQVTSKPNLGVQKTSLNTKNIANAPIIEGGNETTPAIKELELQCFGNPDLFEFIQVNEVTPFQTDYIEVMEITDLGCLVKTSSRVQQIETPNEKERWDQINVNLVFIPGTKIATDKKGNKYLKKA